jgi:hypothetical protein
MTRIVHKSGALFDYDQTALANAEELLLVALADGDVRAVAECRERIKSLRREIYLLTPSAGQEKEL